MEKISVTSINSNSGLNLSLNKNNEKKIVINEDSFEETKQKIVTWFENHKFSIQSNKNNIIASKRIVRPHVLQSIFTGQIIIKVEMKKIGDDIEIGTDIYHRNILGQKIPMDSIKEIRKSRIIQFAYGENVEQMIEHYTIQIGLMNDFYIFLDTLSMRNY